MNFDRYMAIPFKDRGRDFKGADCLGLYLLILAGEASLPASAFGMAWESSNMVARVASVERQCLAGGWFALVCEGDAKSIRKQAQRFDAVIMDGRHEHRPVANMHVACAIGGGKMIHTDSFNGRPRCMDIDDPDVARDVRALWRPKLDDANEAPLILRRGERVLAR